MDPLIVVPATIFGLAFGSFANVVIHRVPLRISVVSPRSACPSCGHEIAGYDNIPVISWLILRGRCRTCKAPISARYPAVELLMAVVFGATAATAPRWEDLILTIPVVFSLTCLAIIDLEIKRLPDALTGPTFVAAVPLAAIAAALAGDLWLLWQGLIAAAVSFVVFYLIAFLARGGFGLGDVKLAPTLGLVMGFADRGGARAFTGFLLAFALGALVGIILMAVGRAGRKTALPFGPFLVLGTIVILWTDDTFVRPWLGS